METVAAFGPELTIEERKVIGEQWLDGLVKKLQRSEWGSRQDNKQYLSDYTVAIIRVSLMGFQDNPTVGKKLQTRHSRFARRRLDCA